MADEITQDGDPAGKARLPWPGAAHLLAAHALPARELGAVLLDEGVEVLDRILHRVDQLSQCGRKHLCRARLGVSHVERGASKLCSDLVRLLQLLGHCTEATVAIVRIEQLTRRRHGTHSRRLRELHSEGVALAHARWHGDIKGLAGVLHRYQIALADTGRAHDVDKGRVSHAWVSLLGGRARSESCTVTIIKCQAKRSQAKPSQISKLEAKPNFEIGLGRNLAWLGLAYYALGLRIFLALIFSVHNTLRRAFVAPPADRNPKEGAAQ